MRVARNVVKQDLTPTVRPIAPLAVALVGLLWPTQIPAPHPAGGTIRGRVVHAITREPLRGAIVGAVKATAGISSATPEVAFLTRDDGGFALPDGPSGSLILVVSKTGFLTAHQHAVIAADAQSIDGLVIPLTPTALVEGRVVDPAGEPVAQAHVRLVAEGGELGSRASRGATSDDRGVFVFDGLTAGAYVVGAARSVVAATELETSMTQTIAVEAGETRNGIDLRVPRQPTPETTTIDAAGRRTRAPVRGTSSIAGTVRDAEGRGRANARVMAVRVDDQIDTIQSGTWMTITDEQGAYLIGGLPAGSFMVGAGTSGAWTFFHGGNFPHHGGTPVPIADGEQKRSVDVVVPEPGAISGTIRDAFGDPVQATVTLSRGMLPSGISTVVRKSTDDRGRYRFSGLPPGEYLVMAERGLPSPLYANDGSGTLRTVGAMPVFHPGVSSSSLASALHVDYATTLQDVDVMADYVPVASMRVTLLPPTGRSFEKIAAGARQHGVLAPPVLPDWSQTGLVAFGAVPAGHWTVVAAAKLARPAGAEQYWSVREIATDGAAPQHATLTLEPGARMTGRIVFNGDGPRPSEIRVRLAPTTPLDHLAIASAEPRIEVERSGIFRISDIGPGRFAIRADAQTRGRQWTLEEATLGGTDVLDLPIQITPGALLRDIVLTLADRTTELSGTVADAVGRPAAGIRLVVVPADARYHWPGSRRLSETFTGGDGAYVVRELPPGDYLIGRPPVARLGADMLLEPGALIPAARVTLAPGEHRVQHVKVVR